ncbi:MAG: DNA repair protein RecO C-terminal domain-containing protein [Legionellaceae bacterium]|nr:DNA repair protein RecO C-terminal domain-containing protein [Legionellaceae bacterium]
MTLHSEQAFLLHQYPSGETSARLELFTQHAGRIFCTAKGLKRKPLHAAPQSFQGLWVHYTCTSRSKYLRQVEHTGPNFFLEGRTLWAGLYLNEILRYTLAEEDPEPALFDAYVETLQKLDQTPTVIEAALRDFECTLLDKSGYTFSWEYEEAGNLAIEPHKQYLFSAGQGFRAVNQGIPGAHLLAFAQGERLNPQVLASAKQVLRQAIHQLIGGRPIRSRDFWYTLRP